MSNDGKSIESTIAEHKKYKKQCDVRVRSGVKLIIGCLAVWLGLWFFYPHLWKVGMSLSILFSITTLFEYMTYKKHDKALRSLTKDTY